MNTKQLLACESSGIQKLQRRLLLPNQFKSIGIVISFISIAFLIYFRFFSENAEFYLMLGGRLFLVGLLMIAISKERIEDEMIINLRSSAFTIAFIWGVIYAVFQPFVNLFVASILKPEKARYADLSVFIILWMMLTIYLAFFYVLKRTR